MTSSVAVFCGAPFDVVKTRIQNHDITNHRAIHQAFYDIYCNEGTLAFYKGAFTKLLKVSVGTFICLCVYESIVLK